MWSDPPTFVEDGTPLPADPLNALSDNAAWLYNQVRRMVPAMPVWRQIWNPDFQITDQVQTGVRIRHVGRYLRTRIHGTLNATPPSSGGEWQPWWKLYYDDRLLIHDIWPETNRTRKWTRNYEIDLSSALPGLVVGVRYQVYAVFGAGDIEGDVEWPYVYEAEMAE
jgi:hypothetical protein